MQRFPEIDDSERVQHGQLLNIVVAAIGILVALPLMLAIGAIIRLTSRGPAIYRQPRIGRDRRRSTVAPALDRRSHDAGGQPFQIYKFRTMRVDCGGAQVWAQVNDPRVTPIGRVLRRFRLDELPQLFNVLRREMNVVGPRPEQPAIFAVLRETIVGYATRQAVLPGITGWAQINLPYDCCLHDVRKKLSFDLEYVRQRSPRDDLRIMVDTVPVMLGLRRDTPAGRRAMFSGVPQATRMRVTPTACAPTVTQQTRGIAQ